MVIVCVWRARLMVNEGIRRALVEGHVRVPEHDRRNAGGRRVDVNLGNVVEHVDQKLPRLDLELDAGAVDGERDCAQGAAS